MAQAGVTTTPDPLASGESLCRSPRFCHIHARRNGSRGTRHHPPWPPLSKGGKGYAARSGFFQEGTVAEARVITPLRPPSQGRERYTSPSDRAQQKHWLRNRLSNPVNTNFSPLHPNPPFARGGKKTLRSPRWHNENGINAVALRGQLFTTPPAHP